MFGFCEKTPAISKAYDQFQGGSWLQLSSGGTFEWQNSKKFFCGCVLSLSSGESLTSKFYYRALISRKDSPQANIRSISGQVIWLWIIKNTG